MASNGWENYKKRKGLSVERAAAENTESVSGWEQYKRNKARESQARNGALAVNPIKRGTYRSEVTAQYDPDDYKNERLAEEAYRIFAGEEAKTSSPGSVLRMGSGEYAAKPVDRRFVGPLTREYIREDMQEDKAGKLRDLTDYLKQKRDERAEEAAARSFAEELKNSVGPTDINEQVRKSLQVDAGVQEVPAQTSLQKGLAELGLPDFSAPRGQQYQLEADPLTGYTNLEIASRYGIDPETLGRVKRPGLQMGNGEAAKLDPQMIGYDNLQNEPDFAEVLKGPQRVQMPDQMIASRTGLDPMEYNAALTQYMTGEEKNNYQYLLNKYGEAEADKYYATLEDALNQRQGLNSALKAMEWPGWAREMYEMFTAGASGFQGALGGMRNAWNAITQNDQTAALPASTYAKMVMAQNNGFWGNLAMDLAESFGQQIPQIMMNSATAGLAKPAAMITTLAPVGTSVLGNVYNQRLKEGYSPKDALKSALASAGLETGLEALGGPAVLSAGALSEKAIDTIVDGIEGGVKRFIARTGFDMLGEGAEEALSAALSPLLQNALLENNPEQFDWAELGYQTLVGALSGGVIGAPANVMTGYAEQKQKAVEAAATGVKNPENTPDQKHNAAKTALEISSVENAEDIADSVVKLANGEKLTQDEMLAIAQTDGALEVAQQIAGAVEPVETTTDSQVNLDRAYNMGRAGMGIADVENLSGSVDEKSTASYERGRRQMIAQQEKRAAQVTRYAQGKRPAMRRGTVSDISPREAQQYNVRTIDRRAMSKKQRSATRALDVLAQATGMKFVLYESNIGKSGHEGRNGWYDNKTQTAYIDIASGYNGEEAMLRTAAHETTHFIENWSPNEYAKLRDFLVEFYHGKGKDTLNALVYAEMDRAEAQERQIDEVEAMHEVVANACEMMLSDPEAIRELAKRNTNLFVRIKLWLDGFIDSVRRAVVGVNVQEESARILMADTAGMREAQKLWYDALEDASVSLRGKISEEVRRQVSEIEQVNPGTDFVLIPGTEFRLVDYTRPQVIRQKVQRKQRPTGIAVRGETGLVPVEQEKAIQEDPEEEFLGFDTAYIRERLASGESRVPEMIAQAEETARTQEKPKKNSAAFRKLLLKWAENEWVNQDLDGSAQAKAFERWAEKWYNAGKEGMQQSRVPFEEADTEYPPFLQDEFYKQGVKEAETSLKRKNARKAAKPAKKKEESINGKEGTADNGTVPEPGQVRSGDLQLLEQREEADVQEPGGGREAVRDDQELGREPGQDDGGTDGERIVRVGSVGDRESADLRERLIDDASDELTVPEAIEQAHEEMAVPSVNYHIEQLSLPRGEKARFNANIDAIRTVKRIIAENRQATPEEQNALSLYVGWGGIANAFDETKSAWKKENNLLKSLLTEEEYAAAKASTLNAHYTEISVIKAMYEGLRKWGFQGGRMLEPSAGIGHFVGAMPADMAQSVAGWRIVELDTITGQIAKYLYPQAKTYIQGFETVKIPDNFIDVAIGNVPFGDYPIVDSAYPKTVTQSIHNYFFGKAIDKVRPGGILMFITSRYTMDAQSTSFREYMAERADLLGAVRLPKTAFKSNAGTEVVTDIVVMQKREKGREMSAETRKFIQFPIYNSFVGNAGYTNSARINAYFNLHPEMVLGNMAMTGSMYGGNELTVEDNGKPLAPQIVEALGKIKAKMTYDQKLKPEYAARAAILAQKTTKNNGYERRKDGIYQNIDGELTKVDMSADDRQRVEGMLELRDTARELLNAQTENRSTTEIKSLRKKLNDLYDAYVDKNGYLNAQKNKKVMGADPDKAFLMALEKYDAKEKTAAKADIFRKNTVAPSVTIERADSAADALGIVLNETGRVDIERIAQLTGQRREDAEKSILDARIVFRNADGALEARDAYLSGNVREKLRVARELVTDDEGYRANVEELEKVQPTDVEYKDIYVKLGATWIPDKIYTEFMQSVLGYSWRHRGNDIRYDSISGKYVVDAKNSDYGYSLANSTEYGAGGYTFLDILDANLNSRTLSVRRDGPDGRKVIDADSTMAVQEMQKKVNEKFQTWLWEDEKRRDMLAKLYNETFNSDVLREYDGEGLTINGANVEKQLRPHQRRAVQRIVQQGGNVLLAHKVGAGKTAEMAGAAMKLRQLGIIKKPMFVVPKNLVAQWGDEFLDFFPGAHILVLNENDFTPGNRKVFANRIATGDYDAVILSYEQFEKIPMSMKAQEDFYQEQIDAAEAAKDAAAAAKGSKGRNVKQIEKSIMRMKAKLQKLNAVKRDTDNIEFEDMGVDGIFVDEAHNFKNLFYTTSMQVNGLGNAEGAKRTFDMYMKVRYLQQLNGGKGIVFATATPVMNSMVEMYTMQRYLQPDVLKRLKIDNFDAWANMFGEVIDTTEMTPAGDGWRVTKSFSRFKNMPELQTLFRSVADVLTDIPDLKIPKMKQGKRILIESDPTEFQMEFIKELAERADAIKSGKVNSSEDNMLKITGEGRKLALSQKLIDSGLDYGEGSKVYKCAETVTQEYKASSEIKGTQIVFCDLSTPKKAASGEDAAEAEDVPDVYNELRRQLIGRGIPAKEIAFIHDYDTNEKKQKLFDSVRKGDVRVLIGSTAKMGVGMNVQERVVALHHIDCPWRPGDLEQREGRALRQGNINTEVAVYTYITKKTFDSRMWGNIERKQGFISQVMNGANTSREIEGDELALSAAEIKAAASGNPLIIEQLGVQNEINRLQGLYRAHMQKRQQAAIDANAARAELASTLEKLPKAKADAAKVQDTSADKFTITIGSKIIDNREEAGNALIAQAKKHIDKQSAKKYSIGKFAGLDLIVDTTLKTGVRGQMDWMADVNPDSANGTIRMLENRAKAIAANVNAMEARITSTQAEIKTLEAVASEPFDRQDKLDELLKRNEEISEILNPKQREAVIGEEEGVEASERNVDYRSDRELLAEALESVAVTEKEKQTLARYKKQAERLDTLSDELKEVNAQIKKMSFAKGQRDTAALANLKARKQLLENTLTREDRALLRLERSQMLKDVLEAERKKATKKAQEKADKRVADYRERIRREERQKSKERMADYKEKVSAEKYKEKIASKVASLTTYLLNPTTKKYIPDVVREPVAEFLSCIRFTSKRQLKGGEPTKKDERFAKSLRALQEALEKVRNAQERNTAEGLFGQYIDLPEGFIDKIKELAREVEAKTEHSPDGYEINSMTRDQLAELNDMLTALNKSLRDVNKFLSEHLYEHVDDMSRDTFMYMGKDMKKRKPGTHAGEFLEWENALPTTVLERFGPAGKAVLYSLRKGYAKLAFNVREVENFSQKTFKPEEARKWEKEVKTFTFGEGEDADTIKIPVADIMSLYCLRKRRQAVQHLQGGGFRVANFEIGAKTYSDKGRTTTEAMLDEIVGVLTDRQREVADALQKYMTEQGGKWGNYVTQRRFGLDFLTEDYYFPIDSDSDILSAMSDEGRKGNPLYALLNITPMKELNPKANNRLVLHSIFDVYADHMSDMAQYNALALPLLDAIKWFNYKESTHLPGGPDTTINQKTVHGTIRDKYGDAAKKYVLTLLEDISGRKVQGRDMARGMGMLHRSNRAMVAFNLRTVLLQPMSYIRAGFTLKTLPMLTATRVAALSPAQRKQITERMQAHSGIALWKELGFYDANISRGMRRLIKHDESLSDKASDFFMKGAEAADRFTLTMIWKACEDQVAKEVGAENLAGNMDKVTDLFEDTVYKTQVVDSVLTKSQYMRNPDFYHKWTSSFMSEGTTTYNMIASGIWKLGDDMRRMNVDEAWKKNGKQIGDAMAVYLVSAGITTLVEMLMTAWYDDDEYETWWEKMKDGWVVNLIDNLNPLELLPAGSVITNAFKTLLSYFDVDVYGYEMTNPLTKGIDLILDTVKQVKQAMEGKGSITPYGVAYTGMKGVSALTAFPVANMSREVVSLWNNTVASRLPGLRVQTYKTPAAEGAAAYLKALRENNDRLAEEMMQELTANKVTGEELEKAMRDAIKAAHMSNQMDEKEAARLLEKYAGYSDTKEDKYEAERLVREWEVKGESGANSQYAWVWNHIAQWDGPALKKEIKELKKLGVEDDQIRDSVLRHFKEIYLNAGRTEKTDLKAHLITALTYMGDTSTKARERIRKWEEEE